MGFEEQGRLKLVGAWEPMVACKYAALDGSLGLWCVFHFRDVKDRQVTSFCTVWEGGGGGVLQSIAPVSIPTHPGGHRAITFSNQEGVRLNPDVFPPLSQVLRSSKASGSSSAQLGFTATLSQNVSPRSCLSRILDFIGHTLTPHSY